jgi:hypothetical protein
VEKKRNIKISQEDLETWNNFISETKFVEDKDKNLSSKKKSKSPNNYDLRVDLTGYTLEEAFERIDHLFEFD